MTKNIGVYDFVDGLVKEGLDKFAIAAKVSEKFGKTPKQSVQSFYNYQSHKRAKESGKTRVYKPKRKFKSKLTKLENTAIIGAKSVEVNFCPLCGLNLRAIKVALKHVWRRGLEWLSCVCHSDR